MSSFWLFERSIIDRERISQKVKNSIFVVIMSVSVVAIILWEIFKAISRRMMLDESDGGDFFAELFENDYAFL